MERETEQEIFRIQRRIAFVLTVIGLTISIINFVHGLQIYGTAEAILRPGVLVLLAATMLFLLTGFINHKAARAMQLALGFLNGAIAILDVYDSIFGLGLFIIFSIVAYKYGFYRKYAIPKIVLEVGTIYALTIFSAGQHPSSTKVMLGLDSVLYISFFLIIAYITYSSEIRRYIKRNEEAEGTISDLLNQRENLHQQLNELNFRIEKFHNKKINFKELGITEREKEVLEALVVFKDTQKEIGERLNISYETVKTHLKHIREKLGVERQTEIIELCRNNFI